MPRLDANGGGIDWNNPITRRRFLKRTGAATAATMLALHGMRVEVLASEPPKITVTKYEKKTGTGAYVEISSGDKVAPNGTLRISYKVEGSGGVWWIKAECGADGYDPPEQSDPKEVSTTGTIEVNAPANITADAYGWLKLIKASSEGGTYSKVGELTGIIIDFVAP